MIRNGNDIGMITNYLGFIKSPPFADIRANGRPHTYKVFNTESGVFQITLSENLLNGAKELVVLGHDLGYDRFAYINTVPETEMDEQEKTYLQSVHKHLKLKENEHLDVSGANGTFGLVRGFLRKKFQQLTGQKPYAARALPSLPQRIENKPEINHG